MSPIGNEPCVLLTMETWGAASGVSEPHLGREDPNGDFSKWGSPDEATFKKLIVKGNARAVPGLKAPSQDVPRFDSRKVAFRNTMRELQFSFPLGQPDCYSTLRTHS